MCNFQVSSGISSQIKISSSFLNTQEARIIRHCWNLAIHTAPYTGKCRQRRNNNQWHQAKTVANCGNEICIFGLLARKNNSYFRVCYHHNQKKHGRFLMSKVYIEAVHTHVGPYYLHIYKQFLKNITQNLQTKFMTRVCWISGKFALQRSITPQSPTYPYTNHKFPYSSTVQNHDR